MKQIYYQKHFYASLFLHMLILMVLVLNIEWSEKTPVVQNSDKPDDVIQAMVMENPPAPKKIVQNPVLPIPMPRPVAPPKPVPTPMVPVKKEVIAIPDKTQKKLKEDLLQKKILADLKKQKQKVIQVEFEKEMKDLRQKALQSQMRQEQKRLEALQAQLRQGVVDKYKALILQAISQYWRIPPNVNKKLSAELFIRLAPGGTVLDVQLIKSSGDESLDRSARAAVFKASPLPVPTEADAFDAFRQFVLKVKPENVLSTENVYQ